jgi:hypothetical protein
MITALDETVPLAPGQALAVSTSNGRTWDIAGTR